MLLGLDEFAGLDWQKHLSSIGACLAAPMTAYRGKGEDVPEVL